MSKPGVPYASLKDQMHTFDLLLFRGTDSISSAVMRVEKAKTGCGDYSHVGLVVRGTDLMPAKEGEEKWLNPNSIYVFESTVSGNLADGCPDVHGESHVGVQLRALDDVVAAYDKPADACLAWCSLLDDKRTPCIVDDAERAKVCRIAYEKYRGLRYDMSAVDLAACAFPSMRRIRNSKAFSRVRDAISRVLYSSKRASGAEGNDNDIISKWQFCSELAANIYKDLGVLAESVEPQDVMPIDFLTRADDPLTTYDADKQIPVLFKPAERFYA